MAMQVSPSLFLIDSKPVSDLTHTFSTALGFRVISSFYMGIQRTLSFLVLVTLSDSYQIIECSVFDYGEVSVQIILPSLPKEYTVQSVHFNSDRSLVSVVFYSPGNEFNKTPLYFSRVYVLNQQHVNVDDLWYPLCTTSDKPIAIQWGFSPHDFFFHVAGEKVQRWTIEVVNEVQIQVKPINVFLKEIIWWRVTTNYRNVECFYAKAGLNNVYEFSIHPIYADSIPGSRTKYVFSNFPSTPSECRFLVDPRNYYNLVLLILSKPTPKGTFEFGVFLPRSRFCKWFEFDPFPEYSRTLTDQSNSDLSSLQLSRNEIQPQISNIPPDKIEQWKNNLQNYKIDFCVLINDTLFIVLPNSETYLVLLDGRNNPRAILKASNPSPHPISFLSNPNLAGSQAPLSTQYVVFDSTTGKKYTSQINCKEIINFNPKAFFPLFHIAILQEGVTSQIFSFLSSKVIECYWNGEIFDEFCLLVYISYRFPQNKKENQNIFFKLNLTTFCPLILDTEQFSSYGQEKSETDRIEANRLLEMVDDVEQFPSRIIKNWAYLLSLFLENSPKILDIFPPKLPKYFLTLLSSFMNPSDNKDNLRDIGLQITAVQLRVAWVLYPALYESGSSDAALSGVRNQTTHIYYQNFDFNNYFIHAYVEMPRMVRLNFEASEICSIHLGEPGKDGGQSASKSGEQSISSYAEQSISSYVDQKGLVPLEDMSAEEVEMIEFNWWKLRHSRITQMDNCIENSDMKQQYQLQKAVLSVQSTEDVPDQSEIYKLYQLLFGPMSDVLHSFHQDNSPLFNT